MQRCILCEAANTILTKEHVIPAWARRAFDIRGPVTVQIREAPKLDLRTSLGKVQHLNITLDDTICKDCNTIWLRQLEDEVRPFLKPMAVSIKPTKLNASRQALLATWAVKTVLLFEMAIRQMYPGSRPDEGYLASPPELAWLRVKREPPPRSLVWLGCWNCQHETPVMYAPSDAPLPAADGHPVQGHFTTLTLGYVALQVFTVDFVSAEQHQATTWNTKPPPWLAQVLIRIWPPPPAEEVSWPPQTFREEDWNQLISWGGALRDSDIA